MKGIVAVDKHWGIGKDGGLLYQSKKDMKLFKNCTMNKVVVMGRKTFDSLPDRKPLKDRVNIVISNNEKLDTDNLFIGNLDEVNEKLKQYNTEDIFIIGGSSIYKEFMNRIDTFYVTHIEASHLDTGCIPDTFMPNLIFENFLPDRCLNARYNFNFNMHVSEWKAAEANGPKAALYCQFLDEEPVCIYTMSMGEWKCVDTSKDLLLFDSKTKQSIYKAVSVCYNVKMISSEEISQGIWRSEIELDCINDICNKLRGIRPIPSYLRVCGFGANDKQSESNLYDAVNSLKIELLK